MSAIVRDELNVKELRFVSEADELAEVELKPDYRTARARGSASTCRWWRRRSPDSTPAHAVATLRDGGHVAISSTARTTS